MNQNDEEKKRATKISVNGFTKLYLISKEEECRLVQLLGSFELGTSNLNAEDLVSAKEDWFLTLRHFGMGRKNLLQKEEFLLAKAVQQHGLAAVKFALLGARSEKANDGYQPANFVQLGRYLDPERFERFLNLGVAAHHHKKGLSFGND